MSNMDQDESEQMQNHSPESLNVIPTGAVDPRKDIEKVRRHVNDNLIMSAVIFYVK